VNLQLQLSACSSYLLLPGPICRHSRRDICKVKIYLTTTGASVTVVLNSSFHSVRKCLSSSCPIKADGCESQFHTSLHCLFTHHAGFFFLEHQKRDCTNRKFPGNSLLLCASFCPTHCICIPYAHSKKCWVVLTQFWVKYGQTQPLGYIFKLHF